MDEKTVKFIEDSEKELQKIIDLFKKKTIAYGTDTDIYHAFKIISALTEGSVSYDSMFKIAEVFKNKHSIALAKGIDVLEADERLRDIIVYCLIQLGMIRDYKNDTKEAK